MAFFVKRKSAFKNDGNQETPFNRSLRNFLSNSTQQQVFYANLEGAYDRRRFDAKDDSVILKYVYNTLYYSEDDSHPPVWNKTEFEQIQGLCGLSNSNSLLHLNEKKTKHCREICEKIVSVSKAFECVDEVHLCCIWIYYFDYRDSKEKAAPVFKIYKKKYGDAAAFLDANLILYDNWDAYLDTATFPRSFLCVPRHGKYSFVGEQLNLEFFCKTLQNQHNNFEKNNFKPFSQIAIHSWLKEFRLLASKVQKKIIGIASELFKRVQNSNVSFSTLAIFCVVSAIKFYNFYKCPGPFFSNLDNLTLMLCNVPRLLDVQEFILSEVKSTVGVTSLISPDGPPCGELLQELISLISQKKKHWLEIFQVMITLLRKAKPAINVIEFAVRSLFHSPVVSGLFQMLYQVLQFEQFCKTQKISPSSSSPENSPSSVKSDGNGETQKAVVPERLENFLKKWDLLERLPAGSVQSVMGEGMFHSSRNSEPSHPIPLAIIEDLAVLYLPGLSVPVLNEYCLRFIGPNVCVRPIGHYDSEVILNSEVLGNLHFIDEFCAVGIFKIEKIRKFELLEGLEMINDEHHG